MAETTNPRRKAFLGEKSRLLPAPHDRVEFTITAYRVWLDDPSSMNCSPQYYGSTEDLIAAGVVTEEMLKSQKTGLTAASGSGLRSRIHKSFGRVIVNSLKYGLLVSFQEAIDLGATLPGISDEMIAAAKARAHAECLPRDIRRGLSAVEVPAARRRPSYLRLVIDNGNVVRS